MRREDGEVGGDQLFAGEVAVGRRVARGQLDETLHLGDHLGRGA
jgi:hypothetical protein